MDPRFEHDRETYYRELYQRGGVLSPGTANAAQFHFEQRMQQLRRDPRVEAFTPESDAAQRAYLRERYGSTPPRGIGLRQGEYISLTPGEATRRTRLLATDNLIDCHALVLVARDSTGRVERTLLGHVDAMTDIASAVPKLLEKMPPGARIEATVLGSPHRDSPYLQAELLEALTASPQVTNIRYHFDGASTVAVDTATGRILTASPRETEASAYNIRELPIAITFSPGDNPVAFSRRILAGGYFTNQQARPLLGLDNAYDPRRGFLLDDLAQFVLERQRSDGMLKREELGEIAQRIGGTLGQKVRLDYARDETGTATVDIVSENGTPISSFFSRRLDPELGPHGTIAGR